jgi:hypothetical protein
MQPTLEDFLAYLDKDLMDAKMWKVIQSNPEHQSEIIRIKKLRSALKSLPDVQPQSHNWDTIQSSLMGVKKEKKLKKRFVAATLVSMLAILVVINFLTPLPVDTDIEPNHNWAALQLYTELDYPSNLGQLITQEIITNEIAIIDHMISYEKMAGREGDFEQLADGRSSLVDALMHISLPVENNMQRIDL